MSIGPGNKWWNNQIPQVEPISSGKCPCSYLDIPCRPHCPCRSKEGQGILAQVINEYPCFNCCSSLLMNKDSVRAKAEFLDQARRMYEDFLKIQ